MAELIKELAHHSKQAINIAMNAVLKGDRKRQFQEMIKEVIEVITPETEKKQKTDQTHGLPSDKKVFEDDIIPQIESGITVYLAQQNRSIDLHWNVNLEFLDIIDEGKCTI